MTKPRKKEEDFVPKLDTNTDCSITVAGSYDNFEALEAVFEHAENLSDSSLNLDLKCIRPGLINRDAENHVMMVPVFSGSYGMLVNNDLFEKEGLSVPTTWTELLKVCEEFKTKGYNNPMMGYSKDSSSCFMYTVAYPLFAATLADNPKALEMANDLEPAAGEYMRPALEVVERLIQGGCINTNLRKRQIRRRLCWQKAQNY
ncbi:MAG: extracellular solute-binding protein [Lachnospiraceae bacterium]|nr:extracellular solute-binding protein [Lachnospiraceae bacterium]